MIIIIFFLQQILKSLFEIIIFEDAGNQWSLSRPILSLIMISEQVPLLLLLLVTMFLFSLSPPSSYCFHVILINFSVLACRCLVI
uniref:Uncharacterized protein n=1 Tax=Aegilops tauschii subsp. strangulata TaxID=200361 RepID=A0A453ERE7_AEGTS